MSFSLGHTWGPVWHKKPVQTNRKPLCLPMLIAKHTKQGDRQERENSTHKTNIHKTYFFLYSECKLSMATLHKIVLGAFGILIRKVSPLIKKSWSSLSPCNLVEHIRLQAPTIALTQSVCYCWLALLLGPIVTAWWRIRSFLFEELGTRRLFGIPYTSKPIYEMFWYSCTNCLTHLVPH